MLIPVLLFIVGLLFLIKGGDWFVDGASALAPFTVPQSATIFGMNSSLVLEIPVMIAVMVLLTAPALVKGKLSRVQGVALLVIYAVFCGIQFTL